MATYRARVHPETDGTWIASSVQLPHCWSRGATRDEALKRLRDEIRYRIELCPCSGVDDAYVQVELEVSAPSAAPPASPSRSRVATLSGVLGCPPEPARRAAATSAASPGDASTGEPSSLGWRRWDD